MALCNLLLLGLPWLVAAVTAANPGCKIRITTKGLELGKELAVQESIGLAPRGGTRPGRAHGSGVPHDGMLPAAGAELVGWGRMFRCPSAAAPLGSFPPQGGWALCAVYIQSGCQEKDWPGPASALGLKRRRGRALASFPPCGAKAGAESGAVVLQ